MIRLIILALVIFLIWMEVIPVRMWFFGAKTLLIGILTRLCISILGFFHNFTYGIFNILGYFYELLSGE